MSRLLSSVLSREKLVCLVRAAGKSGGSPFRRNETGTAAVEMGLIGGTFVLTVCLWIELGLTLFMQAALDRAIRKEARLIRTGALTSSSGATFATNICADMLKMIPCSSLQVNVTSGSSFASLSTAYTTDSSNRLTTTGFNPGSSGQDVVVQVGYARSLYMPIVSSFLGKNGQLLIVSTLAFQNEPF